MLHRRVLPYALALLLISPAASFAASATQDAYDEGDSVVQDDTTSGSDDDTSPSDDTSTDTNTSTPAPSATSTGSLPFTGLEAGLIAVAGLGLVGTGAALRRAAREEQ